MNNTDPLALMLHSRWPEVFIVLQTVLLAGAVVGWGLGSRKLLLEVTKLRLEVDKLKRDEAAADRRIVPPTTEDVHEYAGSRTLARGTRLGRSSIVGIALLIIGIGCAAAAALHSQTSNAVKRLKALQGSRDESHIRSHSALPPLPPQPADRTEVTPADGGASPPSWGLDGSTSGSHEHTPTDVGDRSTSVTTARPSHAVSLSKEDVRPYDAGLFAHGMRNGIDPFARCLTRSNVRLPVVGVTQVTIKAYVGYDAASGEGRLVSARASTESERIVGHDLLSCFVRRYRGVNIPWPFDTHRVLGASCLSFSLSQGPRHKLVMSTPAVDASAACLRDTR